MFHRRAFLAGGAALGASAAQAPRPSDMQDAQAPPKRRLLESRLTLARITEGLLPRAQWKPYPTASERPQWEALPAALRTKLVADAEEALTAPWTLLPATLFLEYVRNGNRSRYERAMRPRRDKLQALVMGECAEGKGRFLDEIANGIWLQCEETWWGYPAHLNLQKSGHGLPEVDAPSIDLFAAEGGVLLAWTHYLLAPQLDKVHRKIAERLRFEMNRRILTPYEQRNDFWWMGLEANRPMNNWNPWVNSNCLACALLMEPNPQRRNALTHKVVRSVDRFLDSYHEDGGCDEGPSYWGHAGGSLFDNLELLHQASGGKLDCFDMLLVKEIGRYIYRAHIADEWYTNFADAGARVGIAGDMVYRFGKRIGDENMQLLGAWDEQKETGVSGSLLRALPALFNHAEIQKAPARPPLVRDVWLSGTGVMAARAKAGSTDGLYLAAQGGHNAESHNHNDVGNFIVYANGKPALIDVGVETYTAKTFSSRRYEIWTMQSAYHNLPTVNGVQQSAGRSFEAKNTAHKADDAAAEFSLDIAAAYPPEAGIESWRRTLRLDRRKGEISVRDAYALRKPGGRVELTLMTPCNVVVGAGQVLLEGAVKVLFDAASTEAVVETVKTEDDRLKPIWGATLRRILLKYKGLPQKGELNVRIVPA